MVLGIADIPDKIKIQWPGGKVTETIIPVNSKEVTVDSNGKLVYHLK